MTVRRKLIRQKSIDRRDNKVLVARIRIANKTSPGKVVSGKIGKKLTLLSILHSCFLIKFQTSKLPGHQ